MAAGTLLLLGALSLTALNLWNEKNAEFQSEQARAALAEVIPHYAPAEIKNVITASAAPLPDVLTATAEPTETMATVMQDVKIKEQDYIGILDIPVLNLSLPILENWNYTFLKVSPCRYAGSYLDDSMIIAAHNYKRHFGLLRELQNGDCVVFTDVTGAAYTYQVTDIETLAGTAAGEMLAGDWDLTLFTCTPGGASRVVVRCKRV